MARGISATTSAAQLSAPDVRAPLAQWAKVVIIAGFAFAAYLLLTLLGHDRADADAAPAHEPGGLSATVQHVTGSDVAAPVTDSVDRVAAPVTGTVTEPVTDTVRKVAKPVTEPVTKHITKPVTDTIEKVAKPVTQPVTKHVVAPVTDTVERVAKPITRTVATVTEPVTAAVTKHVVEPVIDTVGRVATPITDTVDHVVAPVVAPVAAPAVHTDRPDVDPVPSTQPARPSAVDAGSTVSAPSAGVDTAENAIAFASAHPADADRSSPVATSSQTPVHPGAPGTPAPFDPMGGAGAPAPTTTGANGSGGIVAILPQYSIRTAPNGAGRVDTSPEWALLTRADEIQTRPG